MERDKLNLNLCCICQKRKSSAKLSVANDTSTLENVTKERKELCDESHSSTIVKLLQYFENAGDNRAKLNYHRDCYASFTSKQRLQRLRDKQNEVKTERPTTSTERVTRANTVKWDKTKCIICQEDKNEHLRLVMTDNMTEKIVGIGKFRYAVALRMSGLHVTEAGKPNLYAADAMYHSTCVLAAKAEEGRLRRSGDICLPFIEICRELRVCASLGQVLQLSDVWLKFETLANNLGESIPSSFLSRRATFKEKLSDAVGDVYQFFQPLNRQNEDRKMLLIPRKVLASAYADQLLADSDGSEDYKIPIYAPADNDFRTIVHAALTIRAALQQWPGHTGLGVSREEAAAVVPDALHLFLSVLVGGDEALEGDARSDCDTAEVLGADDDDEDGEEVEENMCLPIEDNCVLSVAQDLVYIVSKRKKLTPKHIGLALALHQRTRSRKILELVHRAGHCMSYQKVLAADAVFATKTLESLDPNTGTVIPPNFRPSSDATLHLTADNIDLLTDTLDGKNSFHATQMVAFMRSTLPANDILKTLKLEGPSTIKIPNVLNELCIPPAGSRHEPVFQQPVDLQHYQAVGLEALPHSASAVLQSRLEDISFCIARAESPERKSWTQFHKENSKKTFEVSAIGYLPLILNPAHEYDTLYTVLQRAVSLADHLGKKFIILTTDQNLYYKLVEMRWNSDIFMDRVVLRMGGLHLAMNFMGVIGKHMAGSGLSEMWYESGLLGELVAEKVLSGKKYSKGMRAHKLTYQALWRILTPQLVDFMGGESPDMASAFKAIACDSSAIQLFFEDEQHKSSLANFITSKLEDSENFNYWWSYMDMITTLLRFTKSIRDGDWPLYRQCLTEMLPYMSIYDHGNYVKSLTVYISDMHQLSPEVENAFMAGDFAVLRSNNIFSQVDPDQAQEWVVGTCKDGGGIVGITQSASSLQRWALSFHWRSEVTRQVFEMYRIKSADSCNELLPGRQRRDNTDEDSLLRVMKSCDLLGHDCGVCNIVTKDQASKEIQDSLLNAKERGQESILQFVQKRLIPDDQTGMAETSYYATLPKQHALTLLDLYKTKQTKNASNVMKADREVMSRLLVAYEGGRKIDLKSILKYELLPVPLSIAEMNGVLRTSTEKSSLGKILQTGVNCPASISPPKASSQLIIDGQALVVALGKPANANSFGDLAQHFCKRVQYLGSSFSRVDIVFDRYRDLSVKSTTRNKRAKGRAQVRRNIDNAAVPLPNDWKSFLSLSENKADLANFLSSEIVKFPFTCLDVVVAGGFEDERRVESTNSNTDVHNLAATHEEGDTRVILHATATQNDFNVKVIMARDTDICLLALYHFPKMKCDEVWLMSGTAKERIYIPVHDLASTLSPKQRENILAFHAITGSDTTSKLATITKQGAWSKYLRDADLLTGLGKYPLEEATISRVEKFVVLLYKVPPQTSTGDEARHILFGTVKPEGLPPTSDALRLHILRSHYQCCVWEGAHLPDPPLPDPQSTGWKAADGKLVPVLMTLESVPKVCKDILTCGCKTGCATRSCGCRKSNLPCLKSCSCSAATVTCINKA